MRNVKRASQLLTQACYSGYKGCLQTRNFYPSSGSSPHQGCSGLLGWTESSSASRIIRGFAANNPINSEDVPLPKERKRRTSPKKVSDKIQDAQSEAKDSLTEDQKPSSKNDKGDLNEVQTMEKMKEVILSRTFQTEPGLGTIASLGKPDPRGKGGKNEIKLLRNVIDAVLALNKHRIASQDTGLANYLNFNTVSLPLSLADQSDAAEMLNTLLRDTYLRYELLKGKSIRNSVLLQCHGISVEDEAKKYLRAKTEATPGITQGVSDWQNLSEFTMLKVEERIKNLRRWGTLVEPKDITLSAEPQYIDSCLDALEEVVRRQKVSLDYKPLFWSPSAGVLPSSAVQPVTEVTNTYFVFYSAADGSHTSGSDTSGPNVNAANGIEQYSAGALQKLHPEISFVAEVGQPWSLTGAKALAVHPHKSYTVVYHNSKPLIMATRTIEKMAPMLFYEGKYRKVANYMGSQLVGITVTDPLSGDKIPIILDDSIGESYTSIIPVCPSIYPAHFKLSEEYNLNRSPVVSIEGKIMARNNPDLDGLPLFKTASEAVIYLLVAKKAIADKSVEHETVLYRRKSDKAEQISMTTIPEWVVQLSETEISRYGKFLESKVILSGTQVLDVDNLLLKLSNTSRMVKISGRNKYGIPLPFFRFKSQPNKYLISEKQIKFARGLFLEHGTRIWRDWDTTALLHEDYLTLADQLEPVQANMDENFESSLFWYYLQQKDRMIGSGGSEPVTDILVVDAKNTNEWLRATAVSQALLQGAPAILEVKTHPSLVNTEGKILDSRGPTSASQAISIVEGSVKLNQDQQYGMGAEVFRLWAASIDFAKPTSNSVIFEESLLSQKREELNMIRSGLWRASVVLHQAHQKNPSAQDDSSLLLDDRLSKIYQMLLVQADLFVKSTLHEYKSKNLSGVYSCMMDYLKYHLMDFQLPFLCDQVVQSQDKTAEAVLTYIIRKTLLAISPVIPFTAEENHLHSFQDASLFADPEYYLLKHSWTADKTNIQTLASDYSRLSALQSTVFRQQVLLNKGRPRTEWTATDLIGVYTRDESMQMRDWLTSLGLEETATLLGVRSVQFVLRPEEATGPLVSGYVFASFKQNRMEFKLRKALAPKAAKP